jgi:UDP-glucose 4-epimerase
MDTDVSPSDVLDPVVITGGAGFVGSHLADALADHATVRVLDDLSSGDRSRVPDGVEFVEGDVRDPEVVSEVIADAETVFHEAAVVSVPQSVDEPVESHAVTVDGTLNVLEVAREADARVVAASSAAVYGHPERVPVHESDPKTPTSPYGIDKLAVDHYVRRYNDLYGLETVALRYFNIYGPGQTGGQYAGVVTVFHDQATAGDPITVDGDGTQTRDFVHVDDVVQANLAAATTDAVGEAYNVGTGEATEIRHLAEVMRDVTDSDSDIVHTDPREGDIDRSVASIDWAREALGYEPSVSLAEGLETVASDPSA